MDEFLSEITRSNTWCGFSEDTVNRTVRFVPCHMAIIITLVTFFYMVNVNGETVMVKVLNDDFLGIKSF